MTKTVQISTTGERSDIIIINIRGSLDTVVAHHLQEKMDTLIENGILKFIVNLEQLEYISSAGIGLFSKVILDLRKYDGKIIFMNIPDQAYHIFTVTRLIDIFTIAETLEGAMAILEPSQEAEE